MFRKTILLLMMTLSFALHGEGRVLIAYFTWAENTVVIDRDKAVREANSHVFSMEGGHSADAVTSASVLPPGNTARMAGWIHEITGGDLHSIRVGELYSCYWGECLDRASREKARNARPELIGSAEDMDDYDVIFLGFPTWWYTIPMAVAAFAESYDLSDKTIIPFVAHGTSGVARTIRDLGKLLPPSASLEKEIGIYRSEMAAARPKVIRWLAGYGYEG